MQAQQQVILKLFDLYPSTLFLLVPANVYPCSGCSVLAIIIYSGFSHFNLKLLRPPTFCANTFDKTTWVCVMFGEKYCTLPVCYNKLADKSTVTGVSCDTCTVCIGWSRCQGKCVCVCVYREEHFLLRPSAACCWVQTEFKCLIWKTS